VGLNKLDDLSALNEEMNKYGGIVRILVDNLEQIKFLEDYEKQQGRPKKWSTFIKMDGGQKPGYACFNPTARVCFNSTTSKDVQVHRLNPDRLNRLSRQFLRPL
jgi:hypothetical protein